MAREGQHAATLKVQGSSRGAQKDQQALAQRMQQTEGRVTKLNVAFAKQAAAVNKSTVAMKAQTSVAGKLSAAFGGALGIAGTATIAFFAIDRFANRSIDVSNVMASLRFDMEQVVAATGNMATAFEFSKGAAILQETQLIRNQAAMNQLSSLVATNADKNRIDLVTAWDSVTKAIAKGNPDRLRAIGLMTDGALKIDQFAKAHGVATTEVSLADKQIITFNETLRALKAGAEGATPPVKGLGFGFVAMKNRAVDSIDEALLKANDFTATVGEGMVEALKNMGRSSENAQGDVEDLGIAFIEGGAGGGVLISIITKMGIEIGSLRFKAIQARFAIQNLTTGGAFGGIQEAAATEVARGQADAALAEIAAANLAANLGAVQLEQTLLDVKKKAKKAKASAKKAKEEITAEQAQAGLAVATDFRGDFGAAQADAELIENLDIEVKARQQRRLQASVSERQRALELNRGTNFELMQSELELNEFRQQQAETDQERFQLQEEAKDIRHQADLARLDELTEAEALHAAKLKEAKDKEIAARKAAQLQAIQSAQVVGQAAIGMAFSIDAASRQAKAAGEDESKARQRAAGQGLLALSQQLAGQALGFGAAAAAAAVTLRPGAAARNAAAAGIMGAASLSVGLIGRALVQNAGPVGGGAGAVGGGAGVGAVGGGGAAPPSSGSPSGPGEQPIPVSPSPGAPGPSDAPTTPPPRPGTGGGGTTIILNTQMMTDENVKTVFAHAKRLSRIESIEGFEDQV